MTTENSAINGKEGDSKISLSTLAKMTGFPVEMIQSELFKDQANSEEISLEELRTAMLSYIDASLLMDDKA